ncbi:MAG: hypothetical protein RIQ68_2279 [Pseudomonadota bacterium]|jgi:hypothetical protein
MFTIEIAGRAIAVTNADQSQARELIESEEFREDLAFLLSNGKPVWDGKAELVLRAAKADEVEEFEDAEDLDDDEMEDDGDPAVVFLIDIDDEEEDED